MIEPSIFVVYNALRTTDMIAYNAHLPITPSLAGGQGKGLVNLCGACFNRPKQVFEWVGFTIRRFRLSLLTYHPFSISINVQKILMSLSVNGLHRSLESDRESDILVFKWFSAVSSLDFDLSPKIYEQFQTLTDDRFLFPVGRSLVWCEYFYRYRRLGLYLR